MINDHQKSKIVVFINHCEYLINFIGLAMCWHTRRTSLHCANSSSYLIATSLLLRWVINSDKLFLTLSLLLLYSCVAIFRFISSALYFYILECHLIVDKNSTCHWPLCYPLRNNWNTLDFWTSSANYCKLYCAFYTVYYMCTSNYTFVKNLN